MDCSTSLTHLPICPRLPRGLVFLLVLSLILQLALFVPSSFQPVLPAVTLLPGRAYFRVACLQHRRHGVVVLHVVLLIPCWQALLTLIGHTQVASTPHTLSI